MTRELSDRVKDGELVAWEAKRQAVLGALSENFHADGKEMKSFMAGSVAKTWELSEFKFSVSRRVRVWCI